MTTLFDPLDADQLADPFPVYRELRAHEPVQRIPVGDGTWVVSRYEDVRNLLRTTAGLMQPPGATAPAELEGGPAERIYRGLMVLNDPPVHTRLRKLTEKALTRGAVEKLRSDVDQVVSESLDTMLAAGEVDAITELAFTVPLRVICGMLGVPEADRAQMMAWTPDFFRIFLPQANDPDGIAACHQACQNFIDYLSDQIEYRRRTPADDIFSALVSAEDEGDRLDRDELVATVLSLLTGGFDTTMGMISAGLYGLAKQPEQLEALRADPQGWPGRRWRSSSAGSRRSGSPTAISPRTSPSPVRKFLRERPFGSCCYRPTTMATGSPTRTVSTYAGRATSTSHSAAGGTSASAAHWRDSKARSSSGRSPNGSARSRSRAKLPAAQLPVPFVSDPPRQGNPAVLATRKGLS